MPTPFVITALALALSAPVPAVPISAAPTPTARTTAVAPPQNGEQTVVVTGRRNLDRPCAANDRGCVAAVAAEIWRLYPERVQDWCMKVEVNRERGRYNAASGGPNMGGEMPSTPFTSPDPAAPEAERTLCNYKPQAR